MQLEQSFDLPAAPSVAWPAFKNIELLIQCLPGATLSGPASDDGELPLRFDVKLGPIAAAFVGSGRVSFDDAAQGGRFEGAATDRRTSSRVKGAADFKLAAEGSGTRVSVLVDYALTGTLAQFSRGAIVRELASALTSQFAANLAKQVQSAAPALSGDIVEGESSTVAAPESLSAVVESVEGPVNARLDAHEGARLLVPGAAPSVAPAASLSAAPVALDAGSLLMLVLKARWQRLRDRLFRRPAG